MNVAPNASLTSTDFSVWLKNQLAFSKNGVSAELVAAQIANASSAPADQAGWVALGKKNSTEWRQKFLESQSSALERWHSNHQPHDPVDREKIRQAGVNARKTLLNLLRWEWDSDLSWRRNSPEGYGALRLFADTQERALLKAWVAREGGFDALWAQADNAARRQDLLAVGGVLIEMVWTEEASEWTKGFALWAAQTEAQARADGDKQVERDVSQAKKNAWTSLIHKRKKSDLGARFEKIKTLSQEWKAAGLVPADEKTRAEWFAQWVDERLGSVEWVNVIAGAGFLPSDRSDAARYQPPLHQTFSPNYWPVFGLTEKLLEMGEDPLEKNAAGLSAWDVARAKRSASGHESPAFAALEKRVKAEQERHEMQEAMKRSSEDQEAELGRWALALLRQGAAFDAEGKKLTLADLQTLGPLFLADDEAAQASAALAAPSAQAKTKSRSRL